MRTKFFAILVLAAILLSACAPVASPTPAAVQPETIKETVVVKETQVVEKEVQVVVTPTPGPNPEAVIPNVEEGAELTIWTFWLSPTFDEYIKNTIAGFEAAYPGVKG